MDRRLSVALSANTCFGAKVLWQSISLCRPPAEGLLRLPRKHTSGCKSSRLVHEAISTKRRRLLAAL